LLIVGGDDLMLDSLSPRIASWPMIEIIGWAGSGIEAVSLTEELLPDLVLIDLEERNGDRVDSIRRIEQTAGAPIVVVLDSRDTPVARSESVTAGADGYVTKSDPDERLKALISKMRTRG
jgi:two-component system nitrate/nitrite response regulator NarL